MARDPRGRSRHGTPLPPDPEREAEWEIGHHIEERVDRLVEEGWTREEARREAVRRFGDAGRVRSELARMGRNDEGRRRMTGWLEGTVQDVAYALRGIRRSPGFAATVCLTLGVGIGAAAAIFAVVDAVLLRPLPYDRPEEIVEVSLVRGSTDMTMPFLLADQLDAFRESADFLQSSAYGLVVDRTRTDGPTPEELRFLAASPDLDDLLGIQALVGRTLGADDAAPGAARRIVLGHAYWRRLGADPDVVGRTLRLDDEAWTVVGVLPRHSKFPVAGSEPAGWIPIASDRTVAGEPLQWMQVVGRLAPGIDLDRAQERADRLAAALDETRPHPAGWRVRLARITEWRGDDDVRHALWLLAGAVGLMLSIALANGANLLLLRARVRRRELAVRRAVGASRARLLAQALVESLVLALFGGGVAAAAATGLIHGVGEALPADLSWATVYTPGLGPRSLLFLFGTATVAGLVVGLPASLWTAGRRAARVAEDVRDAGARQSVRSAFAVGSLALSVTLVAGAGLFARSFQELVRVDPGFDADSLALVHLVPTERVYPTPEARGAFLRRVVEEIGSVHGVRAVTVTEGFPPAAYVSLASGVQAEHADPVGALAVPFMTIAPGSEAVLGIEIADGRPFRAGDAERGAAIVDRDFARTLFGEGSAVGRRFRMSADASWREVVGVVEELKLTGIDDRETPLALVNPAADRGLTRPSVTVVARTGGTPDALLPALRAAVQRVDPRQPIGQLTTGTDALAESIARPRFLLLVMSVLAAVATLLAVVGVYGVVSHTVSQRRREMGIRMAVGASRTKVRRSVLSRGAALAAGGALLGALAALSLSHLADGLLFGVGARDPASILTGAAAIFATAVLACWIPARRATRVDPVDVLRSE